MGIGYGKISAAVVFGQHSNIQDGLPAAILGKKNQVGHCFAILEKKSYLLMKFAFTCISWPNFIQMELSN